MKKINKVPRKQQAHLPESLEKRLAVYALAAGAAGVGLLALAPQAKANIVEISSPLFFQVSGNINHTPCSLQVCASQARGMYARRASLDPEAPALPPRFLPRTERRFFFHILVS